MGGRGWWTIQFSILCIWFVISVQPCVAQDVESGTTLVEYKITSKPLPSFWQSAARDAKVLSQDGGFSILLPDGSALWSFADTFIGFRTDDGSPKAEGAVSSSVCRVFQENEKLKAKYRVNEKGVVDFELPLDKKSEDWSKHRIWPSAGVHVDGTSYLFFSRIVLTGKGQWDFRQNAVGLARAKGDSWQFDRIVSPDANSPLAIAPQSAILHQDGNVYLYYLEQVGKFNSRVFVARVPSDRLAEPKAYQFWCGNEAGFTAHKTKNKPLVEDVWGQVSVVWNEYLGKFVMLHVGGVFSGPRSVYLRTAKTPCGSWSEKRFVMGLKGKLGEGFKGLIYCPYLHPELFREKGRIMAFTYCIVEDFNNPSLVEIELMPKKHRRPTTTISKTKYTRRSLQHIIEDNQ